MNIGKNNDIPDTALNSLEHCDKYMFLKFTVKTVS